jgi:hypothetical protein
MNEKLQKKEDGKLAILFVFLIDRKFYKNHLQTGKIYKTILLLFQQPRGG